MAPPQPARSRIGWRLITLLLVLFGVAFRSWRLALVSVAPNLLPLVGALTAMALAGIPAKGNNAVVCSIAYGLAVDDTVHLGSRLWRHWRAGLAPSQAIERAHREVRGEVPTTRLVDRAEVDGVPDRLLSEPGPLYMCQRYDRVPDGPRLHQEDLAQVIGKQPEQKYQCDAARLSAVMKRVLSPAGHSVFLARLIFDCFVGNGDAHLKNWSLLYRDAEGRRASLAPCYDIVPTILYLDRQGPALKMPGVRTFDTVDRRSMTRFLKQTGDGNDATWKHLREWAERIAAAWAESAAARYSPPHRKRIERHFLNVPLLRDLTGLTTKKS